MTLPEFSALQPGDIVRHGADRAAQAYVVMANYGGRVTAVRVADITNSHEWVLVSKVEARSYPNK